MKKWGRSLIEGKKVEEVREREGELVRGEKKRRRRPGNRRVRVKFERRTDTTKT